MSETIWLASYPKSGNTWLRTLIANLSTEGDAAVNINALSEHGGIASARWLWEHFSLVDSGLLTHDELDELRPRLYAALMREPTADGAGARFMKVHDAYTATARGEPILGGALGARGAIVIVRDPRDVAASLANHLGRSVDEAIDFMNDDHAELSGARKAQRGQMRQKLLTWSRHVESWLEQTEVPVHLIRYEDLHADAAGVLVAALAFAGREITADAARHAARLAAFPALQAQERERPFKEWSDPRGEGRPFFRRGQAGAWRDELSAAQITRIEANHAKIMTRLDYGLAATDPRST